MGEPIKGNSRYGSVETEEMDFGGRMDTVGIGRSWEELRNFRRRPRGGGWEPRRRHGMSTVAAYIG